MGPDETLPYIAHEDANCHLSGKDSHNKRTSNFSLCSEAVNISWMGNEKETDERNKGVTFRFLFYFFFYVTSVKLIV